MESLRDFALRRRALVPYDYPFTVPMVMYSGTVLAIGAAAIQRDFTRPWLLIVASALALTPITTFIVAGVKPVPLLAAACSVTAVAVLLSWPPISNDAAPCLLLFVLGEVFALGSWRDGLIVAAASAVLLFAASRTGHLGTPMLYVVFLPLAAMIGRILQLQQRLVLEERARQASLSEQAAADERRRIAREIHDVIAHSLSVTMLHLTGARRALQEDDDVDDAVDALLDAERLGRQAMSDIRHTVGLLSAGEAQPLRATPEPDISDIPDLVASFAAAGLKVDSRIDADPTVLTAGVGLALFRVTQESLANIAKHAPESAVQVRLCHDNGIADLSVHNDLPDDAPEVKPGAGLPGMRQRIEMLGGEFHAGPEPTGWTVQARVPVAQTPTPHACAMQRIGLLRSEIHHD
ncbi:two-component sensor histidine kinase [Mycobacterium sp. CBMA 234]|uniref:sensor histidine kinase n=1 Tax=Mycolicibacterium sp. CBMA 234 TaxID=1918495 RepID=UPI0012DF07E9|nr:histidine kinase [Mycolicibacterium sp. CBMA 234]MUL66337.1 two-component sensor histidine kinase [Mycolicibacterium sp. CBMA 234]